MLLLLYGQGVLILVMTKNFLVLHDIQDPSETYVLPLKRVFSATSPSILFCVTKFPMISHDTSLKPGL